MAQRRMFSLKIIDTDDFISMPSSSRLLYFDLAMRADDEGFISSPQKILKMTGGSQDDFRVLCSKKYIIPFESGVCAIRDWRVHNYIQSDRFDPTLYQHERGKLVIENGKYIENNQFVTDESAQKDPNFVSKMYTQVRLGKILPISSQKDKSFFEDIGLSSTGIDDVQNSKNLKIPYEEIVGLYERYCGHILPSVRMLTEARKTSIKKRYVEGLPTIGAWEKLFSLVSRSDFLMGKVRDREGKSIFLCSFDWILKPANLVKILEHNYDNDRRNTK